MPSHSGRENTVGHAGRRAFVAGGEEAFAGLPHTMAASRRIRLVAFDDGAGPAAEAGVAATGYAGVDLDGAFAVGGTGRGGQVYGSIRDE